MGVIGLALGTSIVISLTLGHLLLLLVALGLAQVSCPHHKQAAFPGLLIALGGLPKKIFYTKEQSSPRTCTFW